MATTLRKQILLANQDIPVVVDGMPMVVEAVAVPADGAPMESVEQVDLSGLHGKWVAESEDPQKPLWLGVRYAHERNIWANPQGGITGLERAKYKCCCCCTAEAYKYLTGRAGNTLLWVDSASTPRIIYEHFEDAGNATVETWVAGQTMEAMVTTPERRHQFGPDHILSHVPRNNMMQVMTSSGSLKATRSEMAIDIAPVPWVVELLRLGFVFQKETVALRRQGQADADMPQAARMRHDSMAIDLKGSTQLQALQAQQAGLPFTPPTGMGGGGMQMMMQRQQQQQMLVRKQQMALQQQMQAGDGMPGGACCCGGAMPGAGGGRSPGGAVPGMTMARDLTARPKGR